MTSNISESRLKNLNTEIKRGKRKNVLFIDNCAAHRTIPKMENVKNLITSSKHYLKTEIT